MAGIWKDLLGWDEDDEEDVSVFFKFTENVNLLFSKFALQFRVVFYIF
jgi:hypothetical protein